jgi:outer membrane protein OmpA-like peptidoglycan-associated protein
MKKIAFALCCAVAMILTSCTTPQKATPVAKKMVTYDILFDVNKATIKPESMKEINRIKAIMDQNPKVRYEVQGHTDGTGDEASNQKLSERRAQAIVDKMVELGISPSRLVPVGKGESEPISTNETEAGRAQNRRVEFVVIQ